MINNKDGLKERIMLKLTDNVYARTDFHGCNSGFVVTGEGAVVIDTPMVPAEAKAWRQAIEEIAPIRYVINNEAHTDHYCGNCYMGGTLIGTEATRTALQRAKVEDWKRELKMMAPDYDTSGDTDFYFRTPDITFTGDMTLYCAAHTLHIMRMPGHTPDQLAVYVPEERVVFTSDNINLGIPIFINAVPYRWLESLDRLNELDVDVVIPGHGEVTDKSAFTRMKKMIQIWLDIAAGAIAEGLELEETRQRFYRAPEFAEVPKDGPMSGFFNMNIDSLYRALKQ